MDKKELMELNAQARELKRTGNFDSLRILAKAKGISDEKINNFILGKCLIIDDTKKEVVNAEVVEEEVNVVIPFYKPF